MDKRPTESETNEFFKDFFNGNQNAAHLNVNNDPKVINDLLNDIDREESEPMTIANTESGALKRIIIMWKNLYSDSDTYIFALLSLIGIIHLIGEFIHAMSSIVRYIKQRRA